jgi:hypothetical protein
LAQKIEFQRTIKEYYQREGAKPMRSLKFDVHDAFDNLHASGLDEQHRAGSSQWKSGDKLKP